MFITTLNQMLVLLILIAVGFILAKTKVADDKSSQILAKLENNVFIPALILSTFVQNFTINSLSTSGKLFLFSLIAEIVIIPFAFLSGKLITKNSFLRKMCTYGFCFSNFGFMGNAIVSALFPQIFVEYVIFTLPLWSLIYIWGAPTLLIPSENQDKKRSFYSRIKPFINPMFISIFIGMILGLLSVKLPIFLSTPIDWLKDCMSPVAMLLTGITVAKVDIKKTIISPISYTASLFRLLVFPLAFIGICALFNVSRFLPDVYIQCMLCALAMPLGLNTIVVPTAYGIDTSDCVGMILISHILSLGTIPLVFELLKYII